MNTARYNHGCFSVKENGVSTLVVVVGGYAASGGYELLTEVLKISENVWQAGPNLPYGIVENKGVESNSCQYLGFTVGGFGSGALIDGAVYHTHKSILGLKKIKENDYQWVPAGEMHAPREGHTVVNAWSLSPIVPNC